MLQTKNSSMTKSATYNLIAKFSQMLIQLIINMVLARILDSNEFGVVAIITVVLNFLNMFADMGLGIAVVQRKNLKDDDLSNLFTASIYLGIVLMVVMCIIGYPASIIYKNKVYITLFSVSSIMAFFNALNVVPNAILMRNKRFDLIAFRTVFVSVACGLIAIVFACFGFSYYSLIINYIANSILMFTWNYLSTRSSRLKFNIKCDLNAVRKFMGRYSLFQFLFNIMNYFTRNLDYLFVGAYMGSSTLGYYQKAYTLNLYPNQLFTNVISGVFHPYMKDYKNNPEKMYDKWLKIIRLLSGIAAFIMCLCSFCSTEIIIIMFGDKWYPATGCFHALSICIWAQMLSSTCASIFLSMERTDQTFKCGIINVFIIMTSIVIGLVANDINILSFCIGLAYNVIFLITVIVMVRETLHQSLRKLAAAIGPDFVFSIMFIIITSCITLDSKGVLYDTVVKVAITFVVFLAFFALTNRIRPLYQIGKRVIEKEK